VATACRSEAPKALADDSESSAALSLAEATSFITPVSLATLAVALILFFRADRDSAWRAWSPGAAVTA